MAAEGRPLDSVGATCLIEEVLSLLGISALAARYPGEISGGQQQRVAIARMIAPRPGILLFDEPLSNLDAKLRVEMRTEFLRVHRATGATSVYVTHEQVEAMTMATHVAIMNNGRVEQFGPPLDLVRHPATAFVATFVGTPPANLVPFSPGKGPVAAEHGSADCGVMGMYRAEDIRVSKAAAENAIALEFVEASPVAGRTMVTGMSGSRPLLMNTRVSRLARPFTFCCRGSLQPCSLVMMERVYREAVVSGQAWRIGMERGTTAARPG